MLHRLIYLLIAFVRILEELGVPMPGNSIIYHAFILLAHSIHEIILELFLSSGEHDICAGIGQPLIPIRRCMQRASCYWVLIRVIAELSSIDGLLQCQLICTSPYQAVSHANVLNLTSSHLNRLGETLPIALCLCRGVCNP